MPSYHYRPNPSKRRHDFNPNSPDFWTTSITAEKRTVIVEWYVNKGIVKKLANKLANNLPRHIELNDLVSGGMKGLLDAINKFDCTKGVLFTTYADKWIKGGILEAGRDYDWLPRSVRKKVLDLEKIYAELERSLGRGPNDDEVAEAMGIPKIKLQKILIDLDNALVKQIPTSDRDDEGVCEPNEQHNQSTPAPFEDCQKHEQEKIITSMIEKDLNLQERYIIEQIYFYDNPLSVIATDLIVTAPRVIQIKNRALLKLGKVLICNYYDSYEENCKYFIGSHFSPCAVDHINDLRHMLCGKKCNNKTIPVPCLCNSNKTTIKKLLLNSYCTKCNMSYYYSFCIGAAVSDTTYRHCPECKRCIKAEEKCGHD